MIKSFIKDCMIEDGNILIFATPLHGSSFIYVYADRNANVHEKILLRYVSNVPIWKVLE